MAYTIEHNACMFIKERFSAKSISNIILVMVARNCVSCNHIELQIFCFAYPPRITLTKYNRLRYAAR
jgi:hypothetical protein